MNLLVMQKSGGRKEHRVPKTQKVFLHKEQKTRRGMFCRRVMEFDVRI